MSRARSGPTVALREVAADLRQRRTAAGRTAADAARVLGVHEDTISRMERAQVTLKRGPVAELLRAYGTTQEEITGVLDQLAAANEPGWWHPYRDLLTPQLASVIDLESAATTIRGYSPGIVPEFLQTPAYARILLERRHPEESDETIDRRIALLQARQHAVFHRHAPVRRVRLWVLLEQAALHRTVGAPQIMREQIDHLNALSADPSSAVAVQVMRLHAPPHPLLTSGPVEIIRLDHPLLADRLVIAGLHKDALTVTEDSDAVRTYMRALDHSVTAAPPPTHPISVPEDAL